MKRMLLTASLSFLTGVIVVAWAHFQGRPLAGAYDRGIVLFTSASLGPNARVAPTIALPVAKDTTVYGDNVPTDAAKSVEVELIGRDNCWQIRYVVEGGNANWPASIPGRKAELHLQSDTNVRLRLASKDFVYMLTLPQINKSQIAVPGKVFALEFRPHSPGTFLLHGNHFCGPPRPSLTLIAVVHSPPDFQAWLKKHERASLETHDKGYNQ